MKESTRAVHHRRELPKDFGRGPKAKPGRGDVARGDSGIRLEEATPGRGQRAPEKKHRLHRLGEKGSSSLPAVAPRKKSKRARASHDRSSVFVPPPDHPLDEGHERNHVV